MPLQNFILCRKQNRLFICKDLTWGAQKLRTPCQTQGHFIRSFAGSGTEISLCPTAYLGQQQPQPLFRQPQLLLQLLSLQPQLLLLPPQKRMRIKMMIHQVLPPKLNRPLLHIEKTLPVDLEHRSVSIPMVFSKRQKVRHHAAASICIFIDRGNRKQFELQ